MWLACPVLGNLAAFMAFSSNPQSHDHKEKILPALPRWVGRGGNSLASCFSVLKQLAPTLLTFQGIHKIWLVWKASIGAVLLFGVGIYSYSALRFYAYRVRHKCNHSDFILNRKGSKSKATLCKFCMLHSQYTHYTSSKSFKVNCSLQTLLKVFL